MPPQVNDVIDGRYRVLGVLGQGGAGRVYRVEDTARSGEVVALKVLERTDEKWAAAFRREFETLAAMSHPNVVRVMDFGPGPEPGTAYFTAELVVGDDIFRATENVDSAEKLALITELVRALAFVHNRGILHRDLKPANILVDRRAPPGERVKLVDFGLARGATRMGKVTLFAGTPPYMAPELLEGYPPTVLTDLYALGVTAYRIFRRELPYQAKTAAALQIARSQGPPPPLPMDVSLEVSHLINTLMDPEPNVRPQSAAILSGRLERSGIGHAPPVVLGEAPLLGRVIPMSMLKVAYEASARNRTAGVVVLTGPAGIGKSRLIGAFEDTVQLVDGRVASTRCEAGVSNPHPLVPLARSVLAFAARSAPAASQRILGDVARGIIPEDNAGLGALAAALDAGTEPRALIVDDAHLADDLTAVVLSFLAVQALSPRLLVVSARDDGTARWPDRVRMLLSMPGIRRIVLTPLNQADSRALAASLMGRSALPVALLRTVDQSRGVPRLVEDAVKQLGSMGALKAGNQGLTFVATNPFLQEQAQQQAEDALKHVDLEDRLLLGALTLTQLPLSAAVLASGLDRPAAAIQVALAALSQGALIKERGADRDGQPLFIPDRTADAGSQGLDRIVRAVAEDGTLQQCQRAAARMVLCVDGPRERAVELLMTSGLGDDVARALLSAAEERPHSREAGRFARAALDVDAASGGTALNADEKSRARRFQERTHPG